MTCTWNSGETATGYVACNPTASASSCCLRGEACLTSGLCYGEIGLVYRGACTDWTSAVCPSQCLTDSNNWANMYPCPQGGWWCGNTTANFACTDGTGTFMSNSFVPGNVLRVAGSSSTTTSTASTSTSGSATPSSGTSFSTSVATAAVSTSSTFLSSDDLCSSRPTSSELVGVGAGLGIPLGIALVALVSLCLFRDRWGKKNHQQIASDEGGSTSIPGQMQAVNQQPYYYELDRNSKPPQSYELSNGN